MIEQRIEKDLFHKTTGQSTKAWLNRKELRRNIVAQYLMRGWSYREIRAEIMARFGLTKGVSLKDISQDANEILKEWREQRIKDIDLTMQLELARIDTLVKEAWAAWEKSKEDFERQKAKQSGTPNNEGGRGGNGVVVVKVEQEKEAIRSCGDPRYLETINRLLIERRKLLGLYAPEKKEIQTDLTFADFLMKTGRRDAQPTNFAND